MIKVTTWFDQHRLAVVAYLEEKKPNCMPNDLWWILMLFVHEIAGIAAISCKSLQRHGALLCNQHHMLKRLVLEINNKVGIVGILTKAQRDAIDEATHQLSDSGDYAVAFITRHRERLDYTFSNEEIENIGRQHKALCDLYRLQPDVKSSIDNFDDSVAYRDAWIGLHNTYPLLEKFVGGLATIFPGTSTVESDFSVVKYEKNKNRMSLTDASFEGILHAK
ncbi:unnamed protein product [Sphagnum jensenii]